LVKKVLIRADGSEQIGLGHLTRTIDIANELKNYNFEITFLTKNFKDAISLIKRNDFKLIKLKKDSTISEEIKEIDANLKENNNFFEITIVDLQKEFNNQTYLDIFKKHSNKIIVFSDDPNPFYIDVDIVFAFSQNQEEYNYEHFKNTKYYTGLRYFPLNKIYQDVKKKEISRDIKNILLTFGGADPKNYSNYISDFLKNVDLKANCVLILGRAFPKRKYKDLLKIKLKNLTIKKDISNMIDFFYESDLCICSAGNTLIELLTCGVPCIVLPQTEIENIRAEFFSKKNMILNMGLHFTDESLISEIKKLISDYSKRKSLNETAQKYLDGKGIKRIINVTLNINNSEN
jgi:spore coat polysaccharide biosynthesis predicted glycosyltransferase SpsG